MALASRTGRALRGLVRISAARPLLTVALSLVAAAGGVFYALNGLSFMTSGRDLLPPDQPYVERYGEYLRDFGDLDEIAVVVESQTLQVAKAYASRIVHELRKHPETFRRVTYRIDPKRFEGRALLYLSPDKLAEIRDR